MAKDKKVEEGANAGKGAAGGNGNVIKYVAKISKMSLTPSRKINLGNYETLECQAGIELTFEEPMVIGDARIAEALAEARKMIQAEFREQVIAFGRKKKEAPQGA